jgi:two-component system chemotaxis response regulator CheY
VRLCAQHQPDLVTLDLTMPEMDGIDCVEELVRIKPDIRVLVVSALSDKATALEAIKRGANGFLFKPFTDDQLVHALKELSQ